MIRLLSNAAENGVMQRSDDLVMVVTLALLAAFFVGTVYAIARILWLNRNISRLLKDPPLSRGPSKHLKVVNQSPYCAESPMWALHNTPTPTPLIYVRNHFDVPHVDADTWTLRVLGLGGQERIFRLHELKELESRLLTVILECAGNGRKAFSPAIKDEIPWEYGAVSTIVFTGIPLRHVLEQVGVQTDEQNDVKEIRFEGIDSHKDKQPGPITSFDSKGPYARSLPLTKAMDDDTLLAWAMDGRPLAPEHGYPLRLVVPGWYAMASVKWLREIVALDHEFKGHFQQDRYVYKNNGLAVPVREVHVRSTIACPADGDRLSAERIPIRGLAWSGKNSITRVEVSTDAGHSWTDAELTKPTKNGRYAPTLWTFEWKPRRNAHPTQHVLMSRATNSEDKTQLPQKEWNLYGYGNNAIQTVLVTVG